MAGGSSNINELPPSKRFKLLQQQLVEEADSKPSKSQCLPAKKRINPHPHPHHHQQQQPTSLCLPAKKRIWAINPHQQPPEEEHVEAPTVKQVYEEEEEEEDGVVCAVCRSTDGDPSDPIVLCDGCDLMVHASCYGKPLAESVPAGDWFCRRCEAEEGEGSGCCCCCLCPTKGGAVKPTVDGGWAHITCALFVPEAFFRDAEGREGIDLSRVPEERREVECYLCGGRGGGCGIVCSEPKCGLGFHVSCGLDEGLCIEYKEGKGGAIVAAFCKDHSLLWTKQQQTGKFKIVAVGSDSKRKARG